MSAHQTRFSDVCGTLDEFKRLLCEESERIVSDTSKVVDPLLDDILYMLRRMMNRLEEYEQFREKVRAIVSHLDSVERVSIEGSIDRIKTLRQQVHGKEDSQKTGIDEMSAVAEEIRSTASAQEQRLRNYKDLALKLFRLFTEIKGNRPWLINEFSPHSFVENLKKEYQAWIPPEPHAAKLLEWLSKSRAFISGQSESERQPIVQFEDGGSMPMSQVRWNPDIRNFHPAAFEPGSTGRQYRRNTQS